MKTTFRKLTLAWPLVIFLLLPALTRAETAVQAWVQRYNGTANDGSSAFGVAVDSSNNVIVTGGSYPSGLYGDYATIKYSSAGVPLWTNRYRGLGYGRDQAYAVAVDGNDDVIVTGSSTGSGGDQDYATIKYSGAGVPLWTNRYNGPGNGDDHAHAMVLDGSNDVLVTGYSTGNGGNCDYATIKYSSEGVPLWTNRYNGPENRSDYAAAVTADASNNVIVTGYSIGSGGAYDYATIKYSSAGVPLWTNRYNGPGNGDDQARGVAVDAGNDVIVTGYSYGSEGYPDYLTIKYSSAGVALWTNRYHGLGNYYDGARAVAVDDSNNVIVTGCLWNGTDYDYATFKYSSAGAPLWANYYHGKATATSWAAAVVVDSHEDVVVTGSSTGSGSDLDYATIKYSSTGVPLWTNRYNGPGNFIDNGVALAVDGNGNVIVTGESYGSSGNHDSATIKYICIPSPVMTAIQLTNGAFQMRVDDVLQPGTLVIEASTNLSATNWAPVFTNTTPTNVLFYTNPDAGNAPTRFYRAFQFP